MASMITPKTLTLTILAADNYRSVGSPAAWAPHIFHVMLALMGGHTLNCFVYNETNVSFKVEEEWLKKAFSELDRGRYYYVHDNDLQACLERFVYGKGNMKPIYMSIPNLYIKETPYQIKKMLENS